MLTRFLHRKEVIQPQVLLRLPCYDFTPIADPTLGRCLYSQRIFLACCFFIHVQFSKNIKITNVIFYFEGFWSFKIEQKLSLTIF